MPTKIWPHMWFNALLFVCLYAGYVDGVKFFQWMFVIFTILMFIGTYGKLHEKDMELHSKIMQSYFDGKHAPEWFDHFIYGVIVSSTAGLGMYIFAVLWSVYWVGDYLTRKQAERMWNEAVDELKNRGEI